MFRKTHEVDMLHGPILPRVLEFALPLLLSGLLQLLYNAADIVVVGRFAGAEALAAVGSTGSLSGLIVNAFMGLSVGASVVTARFYGSGRQEEVRQTVQTSITLALLCGAVVMLIGALFSGRFLRWMDSPPDVLPLATLYLRIYFLGSIPNLVYNFGAGVLRAVGDSRRPLYFLIISGLVNVVLNLILVIVFHMGVAGVAIATVVSQTLSCVLVISCLTRSSACYRLDLRRLGLARGKVKEIVRIGVPSGLQSMLFSVSNVVIQSSINSFGSTFVAANSAVENLQGFLWTSGNCFAQTCMTFTSQNLGAGKRERLMPILRSCLGCAVLLPLCLGLTFRLFAVPLLGLYTTEPEVVSLGIVRLNYICPTYFFYAMIDSLSGHLRGLGHSFDTMLISLVGVCGLRILWVFTVFAANRTPDMLYLSYPVSWILTAAAQFGYTMYIHRRMARKV